MFAAHARTTLSVPPSSVLSGKEGLGPGDEGCAVRAPDTSSPRAVPCGVLGGGAGAPARILEGAAATCRVRKEEGRVVGAPSRRGAWRGAPGRGRRSNGRGAGRAGGASAMKRGTSSALRLIHFYLSGNSYSKYLNS